jgi:hypothetical protein
MRLASSDRQIRTMPAMRQQQPVLDRGDAVPRYVIEAGYGEAEGYGEPAEKDRCDECDCLPTLGV